MKVPATKNGPKGISDFIFFLPLIIKQIPRIAPIKKAKNKATTIPGKPSNNPIKNPSLISPIPIPLPLVTKTNKRKNKAEPKAE